jgi:threonine/homoserine/homoserine lactone efflux protein
MIETSTLLVFAAAVMALLLSPGPNMAFVMAHGMTYGLRVGAAAALGIGLADLILTVLTATGVTAVVTAWPPSFDLIRYAGAAYLLWMAYRAMRRPGELGQVAASQATLRSVFVRAMLNSLLNPKALLFFMVFLPQFADPSKGPVGQQLVMLGCALTAISTSFHTLLGAVGGSVRRFLARHSGAAKLQSRGLATLLVLLAVRLAVMSRPL